MVFESCKSGIESVVTFFAVFFASYYLLLVGGWTNPFETYARQIGPFPPNRGENIKISEPPTSSSCKRLFKIFGESFEDQTIVRAEIILDMTNEQTACSRPQHIKKSELHIPYNRPTGTRTCQLSVWNSSHIKILNNPQFLTTSISSTGTSGTV